MTDSTPSPTAAAAADAGPWWRSVLRRDLPASLVVFLVALPLSLGIALASNAPIMSGVIAAIVGGVVVGALGGAPLQVSGPAAGLVVTVFALTEKLGDWRAVCALIAMAGVVQLVFGVLGVARFVLAVSPAVVHGMLAGIGILIALSQVHVLLGGTPQSSAINNLRDLPGQLADLHGASTALGILTIALLAVWPFLPWKRARSIPAPLVAVVGATLVAVALGLEVDRVRLSAEGHMHAVQAGHVIPDDPAHPVPNQASLLSAIQTPVWPKGLGWGELFQAVLALALIASVESLLCGVATDRLHDGPRANLNRELMAQGVGNTLSGMLGGLPVTGVIVRSSANVDSGAASRASAIFHGVWILVFVAAFPFLIEVIPKSVLAALLVFIGVRLVKLHQVRELREHGELPIYLITVAGVVAIDLLVGVGIGFGCALARLLYKLGHVEVKVQEGEGGQPWRIEVEGALSFLGVPKLSEALARVPKGVTVEVDLAVDSLDHAGWEALDGWRGAHERGGGQVTVDGLADVWEHHASRFAAKPAAQPEDQPAELEAARA
ncbi:MAG: SulP family inorganic anion transporter [Planctomycetota bacterium]